MFDLFPISLLVTALGGVVYIVSNHLSEFSATGGSPEGGENEPSFGIMAKFAGWVNQLPLDGAKAQSLSVAQKLLHKTRVILLKTDNHLMELIGKISKKNETIKNEKANDNSVEFWKDLSDFKQENSVNIPAEPAIKIDLALKGDLERKFFDIKPAVKTVKTRKSSKTTPR
ncbi:MAG: hypothetical protein Q7S78_00585 [Candidatus Azambacteria bacterium]|nr:hypothetical protein [Candidatus Azambacteria bacterium]